MTAPTKGWHQSTTVFRPGMADSLLTCGQYNGGDARVRWHMWWWQPQRLAVFLQEVLAVSSSTFGIWPHLIPPACLSQMCQWSCCIYSVSALVMISMIFVNLHLMQKFRERTQLEDQSIQLHVSHYMQHDSI